MPPSLFSRLLSSFCFHFLHHHSSRPPLLHYHCHAFSFSVLSFSEVFLSAAVDGSLCSSVTVGCHFLFFLSLSHCASLSSLSITFCSPLLFIAFHAETFPLFSPSVHTPLSFTSPFIAHCNPYIHSQVLFSSRLLLPSLFFFKPFFIFFYSGQQKWNLEHSINLP